MPMSCLYCRSENAEGALVCAARSRDIAIPATLIDEFDDLVRKRDSLWDQLRNARAELEMIRNPTKPTLTDGMSVLRRND